LIGKELESKHALLTSIWRFPPERKNGHPAPFPLVLPTRIIYSILGDTKAGIVIDPYVGSGTTCLAAKLLGFDYLGIDISSEYVKDAEKKIKNSEKYKGVVEEEKGLHYVEKTFQERKKNRENTGKFRENNETQVKLL